MQFTTDNLVQYAKTTVEKITKENYNILAAYLWGSLTLEGDPLLEGTTDIDIVLIHSDTPTVGREISRLTEDIHLDISHHPQDVYFQGRELRVDPWMGPALYNIQILYDPQHFMDFTLASVRGMFHRSDYTLQRVRPLIESARQMWMELQMSYNQKDYYKLRMYLDCIQRAANAVALLVGELLTERRFLAAFSERVGMLDRSGMYVGLAGLLGAPSVEVSTLGDWVAAWEVTFDGIPDVDRPIQLHPYRRNYYLRAFDALLKSERPKDVLWPLLQTWTLAVEAMPEGIQATQSWRKACQQLGLLGNALVERLAGLNIYLGQIEQIIDEWAHDQGA
jgi:hypothetical protein